MAPTVVAIDDHGRPAHPLYNRTHGVTVERGALP